jgi:predicted nucleotide-binding protein
MTYRKFRDDDGKKKEFNVFIIHGHSEEWRSVERHINKKLEFNTTVLQENFRGKVILNQFKEDIWFRCPCAVAIMSPDDKIVNGKSQARPNVFFEIGYFLGFQDGYYWDYEDADIEPVIILKEKSIEMNSDLSGVEYIEY